MKTTKAILNYRYFVYFAFDVKTSMFHITLVHETIQFITNR